jgi:hypothetical protein
MFPMRPLMCGGFLVGLGLIGVPYVTAKDYEKEVVQRMEKNSNL